jgi:hypothetical protein
MMDELNMVLCKNCDNCLRFDQNSPRKNVWYNWRCKFYSKESMFDFVTGEFEDRGLSYCRDHNQNGECKNFTKIKFISKFKNKFRKNTEDSRHEYENFEEYKMYKMIHEGK